MAQALAQFAYSYTQRNRLAACKNVLGQIIAWSRDPARMDKLPADAPTLASFEQRRASQELKQASQQQAAHEQQRNEALADQFMARPQATRKTVIEEMQARHSPFAEDAALFAHYKHANWRGGYMRDQFPALAAALAAAEMLARSRTGEARKPALQAAP